MSTRLARSVGIAQLAVGLVTALLPRRVASLAAGDGAVPPDAVVRVLGARQVAQGAVCVVRPSRVVLSGAAAVDAIHATSLVPIIALSPRYRAVAAASAALALAAAAAELRASRA